MTSAKHVYTIACSACNGTGIVPRLSGKTLDGEPVGEIAIIKSELFPATCVKCNGAGAVSAPPPPSSG